jgi:hypothetical protein
MPTRNRSDLPTLGSQTNYVWKSPQSLIQYTNTKSSKHMPPSLVIGTACFVFEDMAATVEVMVTAIAPAPCALCVKNTKL